MKNAYGRKVQPVSAKALEGSEGLVEAYCSVFNNVDYAGEIVRPGFFADTIAEANTQGKELPPIFWSHNAWDQPIGITREAEEVLPYDARLPAAIQQLGGLRVLGQFNLETQAGREAFSNIKLGALRKYSIGYYVIEDKYNRDTGVVELLKGDWLEWSPVNFAANDATLTVGAKSREGKELTEHLYVVRPPIEFVEGSFKRDVRDYHGLTYTVVTGKLRATGNIEEANVRFDADSWDASDAQTLCEDNGHGNGSGTFIGAGGKANEQNREKLADNGARVVAQVSAYLDRVEHVKQLRLEQPQGKAGRVLSEANRRILEGLLPDLKTVTDRVQKLLDDTAVADDGKGANPDDIRRMLGRMQALSVELLATEVAS